jgi:hypothetical protein
METLNLVNGSGWSSGCTNPQPGFKPSWTQIWFSSYIVGVSLQFSFLT